MAASPRGYSIPAVRVTLDEQQGDVAIGADPVPGSTGRPWCGRRLAHTDRPPPDWQGPCHIPGIITPRSDPKRRFMASVMALDMTVRWWATISASQVVTARPDQLRKRPLLRSRWRTA